MVLLGFMVVTGISHFLQFQVIGSIYSMNSREILTVGQHKRNHPFLPNGQHALSMISITSLFIHSSNVGISCI